MGAKLYVANPVSQNFIKSVEMYAVGKVKATAFATLGNLSGVTPIIPDSIIMAKKRNIVIAYVVPNFFITVATEKEKTKKIVASE